jgi:hypothetical protein
MNLGGTGIEALDERFLLVAAHESAISDPLCKPFPFRDKRAGNFEPQTAQKPLILRRLLGTLSSSTQLGNRSL